jgi:uncharacterized peroxidase-related enzyme
MPHLEPLTNDQASPAARPLFDAIQAKFKMVPNIFRAMGHAPKVLQATLAADEAIHHDLDPKLRELAYVTASRVNHCDYCLHYHTHLGKQAGLNDQQLQKAGLALDGSLYGEVEQLVIRFAEQWSKQGKVNEDVVAALAKHLTPAQLVTLSATVGLANWTNRFNETFGMRLP